MPSLFEISVAAFAIGMATNANAPDSAHQPKAEVVVEQAATADVLAPPAIAEVLPAPVMADALGEPASKPITNDAAAQTEIAAAALK